MSWLSPWTAFWLLVILVPLLLLLYILRLRRARQVVPSTLLWSEAAEDIQANTPFQRLRRNLLLLLQLIALLMLACAVAQPRFESAAGRGERTVLLIDRSASMQARDGGGGHTRFEAAIEAARGAIDRLHPGGWFADAGGQTMIVSLGETAEVAQSFTGSRRALLSSIDRLAVTDTAARLKPGLALARVWSSEPDPDNPRKVGDPARLELFSDGGLIDLGEVSLRDAAVVFHRAGEADSVNRSVQSVASERMPDDPGQVQIFASLWNWTPQPRDERVQMSIDGVAVHVEDITLPAARSDASGVLVAGRRDVVFTPVRRPGESLVEVRLVGDDVFPADDVAWDVVPAPDAVKVLLLTEGRVLMRRALSVLPGLDVSIGDADAIDGGVPEDVDLVVLDRVEAKALPQVATLSIDMELPSSHLQWSERRGPESMLVGDPRHPVLRGGAPSDLWVQSPQAAAMDSVVRPILSGQRGPLAMAWEEGGHRRVHLAFDPAGSTWPWDPTFMTFLMDATDWLSRRGLGGDAASSDAGSMVRLAVPRDVSEVTTISPGGAARSWSPREGGRVSWGPVNEAGPWLVQWGGGSSGRRLVSVRLPAESEGNLAVPETLTIGGEQIDPNADAGRPIPLWPWAIAAALLVLLLEWGVYCRRIG